MNIPVYYADLAIYGYSPLLQMPLSAYWAAPALGDSLFFVHADNRPALAEGAIRTAAEGADSREWGLIHHRDFVGIILPSEEEPP